MSKQRIHPQQAPSWPGWCLAAGWCALLLAFSALFGVPAQRLIHAAARCVAWLWKMFFTKPLPDLWLQRLPWLSMAALTLLAYAVLAWLLWRAAFAAWHREGTALAVAGIGSLAFSGACETLQRMIPGRQFSLIQWGLAAAGVCLMLTVVLVLRWMWRRFPRLLNRETVSYLVFGVLTTLVNMAVYGICYNEFGIPNLVSNAIAWVAAVLFAYVVNKWFVFRSRHTTARETAREFALFVGARLLSFGIDELSMWLMVDCLHINSGVSKIAVNVIVLIMNYFFSKWIIFKHKPSSEMAHPNGKV